MEEQIVIVEKNPENPNKEQLMNLSLKFQNTIDLLSELEYY